MDNFQKIEKLVNNTGCSYEEAKTALENCGWDMIDAVINLEREGKVKKVSAGQTSKKEEEVIEIIPEVTVDRSYDNRRQNADSGDAAADSEESAGNAGGAKKSQKKEHRLWNRIKSIMINNRMVILRSNGQMIVDLPILIPVIALLVFFWATLILAVVAMIFGCRFHFEGEDLGKTGINNTMDKATDYAEKVRNDLTGKTNDKQNTDN